MKTTIFSFLGLCLVDFSVGFSVPESARRTVSSDSLDGVRALVKRQIPSHAGSFTFEMTEGSMDSFTLSDFKSGIKIQCTTISACSRGLYT